MRWGLLLEGVLLTCFVAGLLVLSLPHFSQSKVSWRFTPPPAQQQLVAQPNSEQVIALAQVVSSPIKRASTTKRPKAKVSHRKKVKRPSSKPKPVDVNRASLAQLEALPSLGPVLAQAIITTRQAEGPFKCWAQLDQVPRVGEKTLARLHPWLLGLQSCDSEPKAKPAKEAIEPVVVVSKARELDQALSGGLKGIQTVDPLLTEPGQNSSGKLVQEALGEGI